MTLFKKTIGHGPDIVLLHGWGVNSAIWDALAQQLQATYTVTTIDLPGYGRSDILAAAYTLPAVINSILNNAPASATYIGWSLGGLIAQAIACHHPERVNRVVSTASSPRFLHANDWPGAKLPSFNEFAQQVASHPQQALFYFMKLQAQGVTNARHYIRLLQNDFLQGELPAVAALQGGLQILLETDLRQAISQVTLPVNYILGEHDPLVPIAVAEKIQTWLPSAQITRYADAGHIIPLTHPQRLFNDVSQFIQ